MLRERTRGEDRRESGKRGEERRKEKTTCRGRDKGEEEEEGWREEEEDGERRRVGERGLASSTTAGFRSVNGANNASPVSPPAVISRLLPQNLICQFVESLFDVVSSFCAGF